MIQTIVASIAPVAIIIALGWMAGKRAMVQSSHTESFVTFVLTFSVPALLFFITATADLDTLLNGPAVIAFTIAIMGMFALAYVIHALVLGRTTQPAAQAAFVCAFPDMVFIGIPVLTVLMGSDAVISVAIGNLVSSLLLIPIVIVLLELRTADRKSPIAVFGRNMKAVLSKPQVIAPLLGIAYAWLGLPLPEPVEKTLKLLMQTTAGVSLFALGLIISDHKITLTRATVLNVVLKNGLHPAVAIGLVALFHVPQPISKEIIILCAMPTATITTMFARRYETLTTESTSTTLLSTILGIVTLPVVMAILGP